MVFSRREPSLLSKFQRRFRSSNRSSREIIVFICLILLIILIYKKIEINGVPYGHIKKPENVKNSNAADECVLYERNPWDKEYVERFFVKGFDPTKGCTPAKVYTELKDGKIQINEAGKAIGLNCTGSCLYYLGERNITRKYKKKIEGPTEFKCDIVEVRCNKKHADLHGRIYVPPTPKKKKTPETRKPDVYVLLMDATSYPQSLRNFPLSMEFLRKNMSATHFKYFNRVGDYSYSNALPLFIGLTHEEVDKSMYNASSIKPEFSPVELCAKNWSGASIFDDFKAAGYKTMFADEYYSTALGHAKCIGFGSQVMDHMFQPHSIAMEIDVPRVYHRTKTVGACYQQYPELLQYWKEFMNAYEEPKFGFVWETYLGHDDVSASQKFDKFLLKYLQDNMERFDNSYFFFMGDHGFRLSAEILTTKHGVYESNNPLLVMSVPKNMRNNEGLMETITKNSEQLQTVFDVRATFLDIMGPFTRAQHPDEGKRVSHGSSLLKPQPQPRTCKTLPIPFHYCLCEYRTTNLDPNDGYSKTLGKVLIRELNKELAADKSLKGLCNTWVFGSVSKIFQYELSGNLGVFMVTVRTSGFLSGAILQALVIDKGNNTFSISHVIRHDIYGDRGHCSYKSALCDCKKQRYWKEFLRGYFPWFFG